MSWSLSGLLVKSVFVLCDISGVCWEFMRIGVFCRVVVFGMRVVVMRW